MPLRVSRFARSPAKSSRPSVSEKEVAEGRWPRFSTGMRSPPRVTEKFRSSRPAPWDQLSQKLARMRRFEKL